MKNKIKDFIKACFTGKRILTYFVILITPFLAFFMVEMFNGLKIWKMDRALFLFNLIIYYAIFFAAYLISDKVRFSCRFTMIAAWAFATFNHYIFRFRGKPLLFTDYASAKTAMNVAGNYNFMPDMITIAMTALMILFCIGMAFLKIEEHIFPVKRIVDILLSSLAIFLVYAMLFLSGKIEAWNINVYYCDVQDAYLIYGSALTFTLSAENMTAKAPEGYSKESVLEITAPYMSYNTQVEEGVHPNIIAIIDEAFSDLDLVNEIPVNQDYMPFFHSLSENTVRGTLYTSIFGGNTANTEFEFLTGNTMAFQPTGTVPFQTIHSKLPSLTYDLKAEGYQGLNAYHPYERSGWNRVAVYDFLGFHQFYSEEAFENPMYIRKFISDETLFEKIISEYEEAKKQSDAPFYLYTMTMQNHGGYGGENRTNLDYKIEILDKKLDMEDAKMYLNLVKKTDESLEMLLQYFGQVTEPTIIVMFGDHQPGLSDAFYEQLNGNKKYPDKFKVPFVIWANYDIEEAEYEKVSVNYMSAILQKTAGNRLSGYQQYLLDLYQTIPVIHAEGYIDNEGKKYDIADTNSPYYEQVNEYHMLQYNNMYDTGNREDDFFFLSDENH